MPLLMSLLVVLFVSPPLLLLMTEKVTCKKICRPPCRFFPIKWFSLTMSVSYIGSTGARSQQLRIRRRRSYMLTSMKTVLTTQIVRPATWQAASAITDALLAARAADPIRLQR
jgi:hypothetical protein